MGRRKKAASDQTSLFGGGNDGETKTATEEEFSPFSLDDIFGGDGGDEASKQAEEGIQQQEAPPVTETSATDGLGKEVQIPKDGQDDQQEAPGTAPGTVCGSSVKELTELTEWIPGEPIVFDIETGPDWENLESLFEWDPVTCEASRLIGGVFDPATVKTGNMKDSAKIAEKIAAAKDSFESAVASAESDVEAARVAAWKSFVDRSPLDPMTGRVLAIGYGQKGKVKVDHSHDDEASLLTSFWEMFRFATSNRCRRIIGFNSNEFDVPFVVVRSWKNGVDVPTHWKPGRYLNDIWTDLMTHFGAGKWGYRVKLDKVCQFLGLSRKTGDGALFHKLYNGTAEERKQALDYAANDIKMTIELAEMIL